MRVLSTSTINKNINKKDYIKNSEEHYLRQVEATVEALIDSKEEKPVILLTGPSGSGKTTTAFKICAELCEKGVKTHALSMDNYFLPADDPRNEREADGSIDYESPKRLDVDLLSEHLENIINGTEFTLPVFDFVNQKQMKGKQFHRNKNEMVILEGIHALNPNVTGRVIEEASGVYVSVRTRMKSKTGKLLHPSKIRLMRRLARDKFFRNRPAAKTLEFFEHVELGEKKFIEPYKFYAEYNIDTLIAYEAAVYKKFIAADLADLRGSYADFGKYEDMMTILSELNEMSVIDDIPDSSLVREFVGGSVFEY